METPVEFFARVGWYRYGDGIYAPAWRTPELPGGKRVERNGSAWVPKTWFSKGPEFDCPIVAYVNAEVSGWTW